MPMIYAAAMRRSLSIFAAVFALAAAAAGPAQGQSSGDQQYTDPFAGGGSTKTHTTNRKPGGHTGSSTPAPAAPAPAPSAPEAAATPAAGVSGATLPRTGLDLIPLAALGGALLAAGLALIAWSRPARSGGR